jgi:hypothetical protein
MEMTMNCSQLAVAGAGAAAGPDNMALNSAFGNIPAILVQRTADRKIVYIRGHDISFTRAC